MYLNFAVFSVRCPVITILTVLDEVASDVLSDGRPALSSDLHDVFRRLEINL